MRTCSVCGSSIARRSRSGLCRSDAARRSAAATWADPERRARQAETVRASWDSGRRLRHRDAVSASWTPERRARHAAGQAARYSDPSERVRTAQAIRSAPAKGECAYCGGPATEHDHVVPRGRPGWDDPDNVVLACHRCNDSKGPRTPAEWLADGLLGSREVTPMLHIRSFVVALRDETAQGLAEYALILALVAVVAIIALVFLGNNVSSTLSRVGGAV